MKKVRQEIWIFGAKHQSRRGHVTSEKEEKRKRRERRRQGKLLCYFDNMRITEKLEEATIEKRDL